VEFFMQSEPGQVLHGATPRLIDEWQRQPKLWDMVRRAVDDRGMPGQFILTGSATPNPEVKRHSGAGRFAILRMRPMSLSESGAGTNQVSLHEIETTGQCPTVQPVIDSLAGWSELIVKGGWPAMLDRSARDCADYAADYVSLVAEVDIPEETGVRRDPVRIGRLLTSLARNTATEASITTLSKDAGGDAGVLSRDTVMRYLDALERLMVVEPAPAWSTQLRGSVRLRQARTWHFVDPSLAAAAIGATPSRLLTEPKTLGLLFESLAMRDLRIYADVHRGRLFHARDSAGREVDAIIEYPDGWIACEVKLGYGQVDEAAAHLAAFVPMVETQTVGPCKARVVITGTGPGYQRPDGICVVPLAALTV
jgi:predicted AAA+ superfamily ATPase